MQIKMVTSFGISLFLLATTVEAEYPIAGVNPSVRPADAPVVTRIYHDQAWYQRALHGIEPPYPASFRFLENQGNWYTPFNHPGLLGPYDLRNWHQ